MKKATTVEIASCKNLLAMQLSEGSVLILDDGHFWNVKSVKAAKKSGNVIITVSNDEKTYEFETHVSNRYPRFAHIIPA